jgi:hypothetical protein
MSVFLVCFLKKNVLLTAGAPPKSSKKLEIYKIDVDEAAEVVVLRYCSCCSTQYHSQRKQFR